jgi:ribosomal protein L37AE/L43A
MKRTWKTPLLLTHCDTCCRRRTCYPMPARVWMCKECLRRFARVGIKAMDAFHRQGR